ncbi:MAG: hypothetical protein DMG11_33875 [Acidobacteria bacterium]|nr:MAG: hypothetical protein DMG11_33875 [Acidobacteriota bacterium]
MLQGGPLSDRTLNGGAFRIHDLLPRVAVMRVGAERQESPDNRYQPQSILHLFVFHVFSRLQRLALHAVCQYTTQTPIRSSRTDFSMKRRVLRV